VIHLDEIGNDGLSALGIIFLELFHVEPEKKIQLFK
jgi:hypothetical protein